jgi:hypothetical protein
MNIDVLKDNPGWYWYLILAVISLGANQVIHQYLQEPVGGASRDPLLSADLHQPQRIPDHCISS